MVIEAAAWLPLQLEEGCFLLGAAHRSGETSKQGEYGLAFHLSAILLRAAKLCDFIRKCIQLMEVIEYVEVNYNFFLLHFMGLD